ncbi:MAG TPA: M56 family metallopeptidase [Gemmatimonadaceae bacterium]|nr:M56 family metallopeptidase [Gemmatimonadaceae bacterium]
MHAIVGLLRSLPLESVALVLVDVLLKGTLLLGAATLVTRLMRRRSAASRHLVWTLATAGLISLPVLTLLLPALRIELLPALTLETVTVSAPVSAPVSPATEAEAEPAPARDTERSAQPPRQWAEAELAAEGPPSSDWEAAETSGAASTAVSAPVAEALSIPWWQMLVALWAAGVVLLLLRLALGTVVVWRMARSAQPLDDAHWRAVVRHASTQLGVIRDVQVRVVDRLTTPMVCGVIAPTIILPAEALRWSSERRLIVALHELAHVHRRDAAVEVAFQLALAIFWLHPLVWVAAREMRLERERACDDWVLATRTKPSAYADHLLEIVRTLGAAAHPSVAALAMARRSQFEGRLLAILDPRQKRGSVPRRARALSASAAAIVILPLSAINPWLNGPDLSDPPASAAEAAREDVPASGAPLSPEASVASVSAPSAIATPTDDASSAFFQCAEQKVRGTWIHTNFEEHDDRTKKMRVVMAENGRCLEVTSEGRVTFADDEHDVVAVSNGGHFSVMESFSGTTRKLMIRPGANGQLDRRYTVNGAAKEFDAEGRAWFSRMILDVIRETGYDADGRVQRLLAKGGVREVLSEVDRITSSGGKTRYLDVLLDVRQMSRDTLRLVAGVVADDIKSSGDKARLLAKIAEQPESDESVRPSVIKAAETISSSGDQRRVLSALLEESNGVESLILAARAARRIASSGDKTAILLEIAEKYEENDSLRAAYLSAAATIPSSGDRTRALLALLDETTIPAEMLPELLEAARGIASSGDRTRLLVQVAEGYSLGDEAVRAAFYEAVEGVASSSDLRRVLTTVLARDEQSDAELLAVIEASGKIASSTDRMAVLLDLANSHGLSSAAVRDAFLNAAEALPSDSDYRRLMSTITRERSLQF